MTQKTIIIIGAGIAGMAAGCYAQMNGYKTRIFELHNLPGGLCTAWERAGYTFDGCIHYLFGSGEGQPFNSMWKELGAVQNRSMVNHSEYQRLTDGQKTLTVYVDPDRLEAHLLELSPGDAGVIRPFIDGIRRLGRFDLAAMYTKAKPLMNLFDWRTLGFKMMPFAPALARWATLSCGEFGRKFKDPFLRRAVPQIFSWDEAPVMMGMMLLAYMHSGNAGFPVGGSLAFARAIEKRYLDLGGEIYYRGQVEKILTENGRAVGVRLYNDEIYRADFILSAADGHGTIFDMLGVEFTDRRIRRMYDGHLPTHKMMQISLGVRRDLSAEPHWVTHLLDEPLLLAGELRSEIGVKNYCFDPSLAPAGKSVIELIVRTNYAYWQHIYGRGPYDSEQRQVSDIIIDQLEKWMPGLHSDIEFTDEATPLSYERYTNNWMGATCGWLLTKQTMPMMIFGVPKTLPGLRNFCMAGQWVEPGGTVTLAAASGKNAVQYICAQDGKRFTSGL
ncbi:MAG TPA: NAD(P)/FAD-dependent oxidoreductase [Anaerolineaceae bacterium]|nr:NAD(P)/FAD-dependent oxidoreductase [Anaerolineaceae bacterium]